MTTAALIRVCMRSLAAAGAIACMASCGRYGSGSPSAGGVQPQHAVTPHAVPADALAQDLVEAVGTSRGTGPVDLQFALRQRPVAGQPLTVKLRLSAATPLDRVEAHFHADDGLDIRDGAQLNSVEHLQAGAGVDHDLSVIPEHEGVYGIVATITTTSQSESVSRSFSIPILVDPAAPPRSTPAAGPATGSAATPAAGGAQH